MMGPRILLTDMVPHTPQLYVREKYPLQFFVCYVHPVTQQYESRTVR